MRYTPTLAETEALLDVVAHDYRSDDARRDALDAAKSILALCGPLLHSPADLRLLAQHILRLLFLTFAGRADTPLGYDHWYDFGSLRAAAREATDLAGLLARAEADVVWSGPEFVHFNERRESGNPAGGGADSYAAERRLPTLPAATRLLRLLGIPYTSEQVGAPVEAPPVEGMRVLAGVYEEGPTTYRVGLVVFEPDPPGRITPRLRTAARTLDLRLQRALLEDDECLGASG